MKRDFVRVFAGGDAHAGHKTGLTPPGWWTTHEPAWFEIQKSMWSWFEPKINELRPFDFALWNADMIDGRGERSGGTELITTDRGKQVDIACEIVNFVNAPVNYFTYGTPYHTGVEEDWELQIARRFEADIRGHQWVNIRGVTFDFKHFVSSSQIPHGRHTSVARERMWNTLWTEHGAAHRADVILRNHVHYYNFCGGAGWLAMTLPALQGFGSKFGTRRCSGTVDFGFVVFDIYPGGRYRWKDHTVVLKTFKPVLHKH